MFFIFRENKEFDHEYDEFHKSECEASLTSVASRVLDHCDCSIENMRLPMMTRL